MKNQLTKLNVLIGSILLILSSTFLLIGGYDAPGLGIGYILTIGGYDVSEFSVGPRYA